MFKMSRWTFIKIKCYLKQQIKGLSVYDDYKMGGEMGRVGDSSSMLILVIKLVALSGKWYLTII